MARSKAGAESAAWGSTLWLASRTAKGIRRIQKAQAVPAILFAVAQQHAPPGFPRRAGVAQRTHGLLEDAEVVLLEPVANELAGDGEFDLPVIGADYVQRTEPGFELFTTDTRTKLLEQGSQQVPICHGQLRVRGVGVDHVGCVG